VEQAIIQVEDSMTEATNITEQENQKPKVEVHAGGSNPVYGIGLIGAWVYYFQRATTPQERMQAFFKGFAWPALLVYELFKFLEKK
jgi:hypothetical protein